MLDENQSVIACSENSYFDPDRGYFVSRIQEHFVAGRQTVHIVIDGSYDDCGEYLVEVSAAPYVPCEPACPSGAMLEGEPPLQDGYLDSRNGGRNSPEFGTPFQ